MTLPPGRLTRQRPVSTPGHGHVRLEAVVVEVSGDLREHGQHRVVQRTDGCTNSTLIRAAESRGGTRIEFTLSSSTPDWPSVGHIDHFDRGNACKRAESKGERKTTIF